MLNVKEMITKKGEDIKKKKLSPVEEALEDFRKQHGYDFLDMINNPAIRKKHMLKQHQIPENNDNDFLEKFQRYQGGEEED